MKITVDNKIAFRGPLDGMVTNFLRVCDTNEVVNAVGLDIGAMVIPRTAYDTKERNEYAGAETFFREISGTFINCLSAGLLAQGISHVAAKNVMPDTKINPNSWYTDSSVNTLKSAWEQSGNTQKYVETVLDNISGRDGHKINNFRDIEWNNIDWINEEKWNDIHWNNKKYQNIEEKLKTKEGFVTTLKDIIEDTNITKNDRKNVFSIMEKRLTNALGAGRDTWIKIGDHKLETSLDIILRDTHDMAKDIFNNKQVNVENAFKKITKINKIKAAGAIAGASLLGLTNQYINRKITEKRTGKKGFVGNTDFSSDTQEVKQKDKYLLLKKIGASILMAGMVFSTMGVKNGKEFAKKLEFTGPITSGNAIKTVYGANIIGRFLAADDGDELRESMTRDYLGFLNWLVFGGFAAKGVANMLDKKGENLFNYKKEGKGIKHWLKEMNLKTHNEIAAKGSNFANKNIWKLNLAHASGITYSAVTLGILLPMLNAKVTEHKNKNKNNKKKNNNLNIAA